MGAIEWVLGIAIVVLSVFLVIVVLMQSDKDKKLSGTISGGAETYFGKGKGKSKDKILARTTTIVSIVFAILVITAYVYITKLHG